MTLSRIIARSFRFERVGLTNWVKTQILEGRSFLIKRKKSRNMSQILYTVVLSVKKLPCPSSICPMPILPCLSLPSLSCATKPFLSSPWLPMKSFLSTAIYDTNSGRKVIDKKSVFRRKKKLSCNQKLHIFKTFTFPRIILFLMDAAAHAQKKITQAVILIQPKVSRLRGHVSKND